MYMGFGSTQEKQLFRKAAGEQTTVGIMHRMNGEHAGIHNRQSLVLSFSIDIACHTSCCLFSYLSVCDQRTEFNQNYKNFPSTKMLR